MVGSFWQFFEGVVVAMTVQERAYSHDIWSRNCIPGILPHGNVAVVGSPRRALVEWEILRNIWRMGIFWSSLFHGSK